MFSWLAKQMLSRTMARTRAGDIGPTLQMEADDVRFRFPGKNSWAGEFVGKPEVEQWLRRFADVGIQIYPDEVVLKGFPWKQTLCVRGRDHLSAPTGELVYENRYVIWGQMSWGKLKDYEVYEDTEKATALDNYLATNQPSVSAA
jgi:ketosteroid isomerase-like protein